tara:strand:+ start:128 stop:778 length:651 start_codon:yes stop_codon:yes gene_type:complete
MSIEKKIEEALSRSVCGGWDRGFLESILEQMIKGKSLSIKQKQTLGKILARNTAEHQIAHENWSSVYEKEYKIDALVLAEYHIHQPYYKPMATDILSGQVPERGKFLRMFNNKYSKKVLGEYKKDPRYEKGDYVMPRASFSPYKNAEYPIAGDWVSDRGIVEKFKKRGGFVLSIEGVIKNAAKGAKRYKILTIGESRPLIVEERFLKYGKKPTKRK